MTSSPRPRLLFLSHRLPFPPHNGAALRTYNVLRQLAVEYDITALCFDRTDPATRTMPLAERLAGVAPLGRFEVFPIPQQHSRARALWDHARSALTRRSYTHYVHEDEAYTRRLDELLVTERFDVVHMDSMDLVRFLPRLAALPVVCTHHNAESDLLARRARSVRSWWRAAYLRFQARRLAADERYWLPRIALNVTVSEPDTEILRALAPTARFEVIPNGVDTEYFHPSPDGPAPDGAGCVFVGGTTWYPNRDALEWFVGEILPRIRAQGENAPITWVGRATEREIARYDGREGLRVTGYVDDIRPWVWGASCFIAPLRVGSGTRLKLLDAWAMGMAIVSTSIGAEGLATEPGENILLADDADAFAAAVLRVLRDSELRRRLGRGGRRTAEERYGWTLLGERIRARYREASRRATPAITSSPTEA